MASLPSNTLGISKRHVLRVGGLEEEVTARSILEIFIFVLKERPRESEKVPARRRDHLGGGWDAGKNTKLLLTLELLLNIL